MNQLATIQPANDDDEAPGTLIEFLARAVRDPSIDVGKLEAIYRMQREIVADDRRARFHDAMNAVQGETQAVVRNAVNTETKSKYATLEAVDAAIRPIYTAHGFALSFTETPHDAPELKVTCHVTRRGHQETYFLSALPDTAGPKGTPNKTSVQGTGSSVSYLRRYLTCMIFNIALRDDNDGNRNRPNNDGELAGRNQADELYRLLAECSANGVADETSERTFLTKMNLGELRSIKDVPVGHFVRLKNALLTKRNILQQRAARAANTQTGV